MSRILSCPYPDNINPLTLNGFQLSIDKLPEVTFWCQTVDVPTIGLNSVSVKTPLSTMFDGGTVIDFGELKVEFLVDEKMKNYSSVYKWMVGLGYPVSNDQRVIFESDNEFDHSDGSLVILNSANRPAGTFKFVDLIPTSLSGITMTTKTDDIIYFAAAAAFRYAYYTIE